MARLFQAQLQLADASPIDCQLELADHLRRSPADPELLHRAISNLVLNAMDAMPEGGTLTLRTRHDAAIGHRSKIADTGVGLDTAKSASAFSRRTTPASSTGPGSGWRSCNRW